MTAKELLLVLLVAGTAGAGAGIGASVVSQPAAAPDTASARDAQLGRIEAALDRISGEQDAGRKAVATLTEKVTGLEMDVNSAREEARAAADDAPDGVAPEARPGRARRPVDAAEIRRLLADAGGKDGKVPAGATFRFEGGGPDGAVLGVDGAPIAEAIGKGLEGIASGWRLRLLPEEKRWEQAKTDMNLNDGQVDMLKRAIAERDDAMKAATDVQTSGDGTSRQFTIRRRDPEKAKAAKEDYDRKVSNILDQNQKKAWDEKGYDHAFGNGGGAHAIAIVQSVDVSTDGTKTEGTPGGK